MGPHVTQIKPFLKKEKTRLLLLNKAAQMFSQRGYQSTSLQDIAAAANMKAGSLYYHFASKEALIIEVLNKSMQFISDTVGEEIEKLDDGFTFEEGLHAYILGHLTAILKHSDYTTTTIRNDGQVPASVHKAVRVKREHYEQQWRNLMLQGKEEGAIRASLDEKLLRLMILGASNWSSVWYKSDGHSIDELAREYTNVFLKGCN
ncbi:MAG: TetR family transcriptional regulator [Piscirickettsiaceae bacterium]|nr:MAG: TetR family transcriptional regulator [Piscirickettsiaceae bacterium]